jgi:hypothetical protein
VAGLLFSHGNFFSLRWKWRFSVEGLQGYPGGGLGIPGESHGEVGSDKELVVLTKRQEPSERKWEKERKEKR